MMNTLNFMKKLLTFIVAFVLVSPVMGIGRNDGSTKANAIDFDWDTGNVHPGGTLWYRVDLAPLYEEDNPSLSLYMTNPSRDASVDVSMTATVAGEKESKDYTIAAHQYKSYSANAGMLVRMKQTEIYLTLVSDGAIRLSAKVFEASDLDETCKDAQTLKWNVETTQTKGYAAWWKVDLTTAKNAVKKDARITITNIGSGEVELRAGQSLDCPSSGLTKRTYTLAAGQSLYDTIPQSMINGVQPDELYFSIENIAQPVRMKVELIDQPLDPVIPATMSLTPLHVTDTIEPLAAGTYLFWMTKAEMNALAKYEPEFTYRNNGTDTAHVSVKMAFHLPAYGTSNTEYELGAGQEEIVVYKKNMLEGLGEDVDTIYWLTTIDQPIHFYGRFKHVREGKACKTNIDFNWESGHRQEARTTQWYAIDVADARDNLMDIVVFVQNEGSASAKVKASVAFSCPYIDLQETTRTLAANSAPVSRTLGFSSYAMMSDTVWIGLETSQDIKFWATTQPATINEDPDTVCLHALPFNWEEGVRQNAGDTVWYLINMEEVREQAAKFPTVFVQNMSSSKAAKITAELSLECPDEIENQKRSLTIAANGSFSKKLSRNLFENIVQDEIYLCVVSTQDVALQIRLTEEAEGTNCASAIPFNWTSGNTQAANANLWYKVDLCEVMRGTDDLNLTIENTSGAECKGVGQLTFGCPDEETPSVQSFTLAAHEVKTIFRPHSALYLLPDSAVYINLQGSTAMRISAARVDAAPFTPVSGEGITLDTLLLDATKTTVQATATQWYLIPKEEIAHLHEMNEDQPYTPTIQIENIGASAYDVTIEAAFAFPVTETMIGQKATVESGQTFAHTLDYKLFMRAIRMHDSVFVRITIPAEAVGKIRFKSGMAKAFSGNSRYDALPFRIGEIYNQQAETSIWYRINTADLKKDKDLYRKRIKAYTKNIGTGTAKVSVAVYEGLLSEVDLLEEYGLEDYRQRKVKKGEERKRTFPAQAIYALGDVDLYVQVTTDQKLGFRTRFSDVYDAADPDPKQQEATLLVPNVDYVIPGDNQEHWYMVCFPYIRNNYKYVHASTLTYEVNGKTTVYTTATLQDTMDCKMPERKRVLNKKGGHYTRTKPLSDLLNSAIKKATKHEFDLTSFQEDFIDEQLRHYISSDSLTGYIRVRTDKDIKVHIYLPQVTGDACNAPMPFDWEHGNVNPAGSDVWYHVKLDSLIVPDTCDLRIHVDNWSTDSTKAIADIYFDCNDPKTTGANYTLEPGEGNHKDIDRDFLSKLGWADMIINYTSDKTSHIWAELIPNAPRQYDYDTVTVYVCQGGSFTDTITGEVVDPVDYSMSWNDTVAWQDGLTMRDSVTTFYIHPLVTPELLSVSDMKLNGLAPMLIQGMQLFADSSNVKLTEYYRNFSDAVDTIIAVDTVYWAEPVYKANGELDVEQENPLDLTSFYTRNQVTDTLLFVLRGGCETVFRTHVVFPVEDFKYVTKKDTICPPMPAVNTDTLASTMTVLDTLNLPRYIDTIVTYYTRTLPELYDEDELWLKPTVTNGAAIDTLFTLRSLKQQFIDDADELTMAVEDAKWQVLDGAEWKDLPYMVAMSATSATMRYVITTECGDELTSGNILYSLSACVPTTGDTTAVACDEFNWHGKNYTTTGLYKDTLVNLAGCDSIVTLDLTIHTSTANDTTVAACNSFDWRGKTYTATGTYKDTIPNVAGCDSVFTLHLTINTPSEGDTTATACDAFEWHGKTYTATGDYIDTIPNVAGCDSVITLHLTVNRSSVSDEVVDACDSYEWRDKTYTVSGIYKDTMPNLAGCDSVMTLNLTIHNSVVATPETYDECNLFVWHGVLYNEEGTHTYYDTLTTIHGCDSVCQLTLTITTPYDTTLSLVHKFGDRLLMINRNEINALPGWQLDSLDNEHPEYVSWYEIDLNGDTTKVWEGYYYTLPSGEPFPDGYSYYAVVDIPASAGAKCGAKGTTETYTIPVKAGAPALIPSLAKPGETIRIIHLNPEKETCIRIYTSDGLLQRSYTAYGEETFVINAADANGFYLVELSNDSMKTTLRYIVK